jgi:glycosyltransferase involved in cell wall biosynthesis
MKVYLKRFLGRVQDINVAPFHGWEPSNEVCVHKYDFIYVASGELHKNHHTLIEAWKILSYESLFPTLALTINGKVFSGLTQHLDSMIKKFNLKIINLGMVNSSDITVILKSSTALIYPSKIESFGMPLIEAQILNIPVIASELDYVRDVIVPNETFDPNSPLSIARAVKRFLKIDSENCVLINPSDFLVSILNFRENI